MANTKEQWEEQAIERFRDFLGRERATVYAITGRDVVVNPDTGENFDYQLQAQDGSKAAVEIFRLIESGKELARQKIWWSLIDRLKKELVDRGVKGYLISTQEFAVKKKDIPAYSLELASKIEQAIKDNEELEKFKYEGFDFRKMSNLDTIAFSYHSGVKSVDSRGTAVRGFAGKLSKKNQQIAISGHERILLVVSWATFVDGAGAIRALSGFDFSELRNIDKIFFEPREGQFVLVYDRVVIEALKNKQALNDPSSLELLLQYARYQLGEKKQEALDYVKALTALTGDMTWLTDSSAKENLISFGEELLEKDGVDDAMWIIRQLHADQDPKPDGTNESDDPKGEHNYHIKALRGEDTAIITTVRGHLCWLMRGVIGKNQTQYYKEIIDITARYLSENNLYIRIQAAIVLNELWRRRLATRTQSGEVFDWKQEERLYVRELVLNAVRANREYPSVMEALLHVFDSLRDLNEEEAEEILNLFLETQNDEILHNLAAYIVYFAFFRKIDAPHYGGDFNSDRFIDILKEQTRNGTVSMRSSLSWHFWKILSDKLLPYEVIRPFLVLFLEGENAGEVISNMSLLFEELSKTASKDAALFYDQAIKNLEAYLKTQPTGGHHSYIGGIEEMMPILAQEPDRLLAVVRCLKSIWDMKVGVYIGNFSTIFGSYALVPATQKEKTKIALKAIHDEMKTQQPDLPEMNWNK